MDFRTLSKVLVEVDRMLPPDVRNAIAEGIEKASDVLMEFGEAFDDVVSNSTKENRSTIYDDVRKDVGDPPGSFEDIVAGWNNEAGPADLPDAERSEGGGRVDLDDVIDIVYRYVTENNDAYAPYNDEHAQWNKDNPMFIVTDFLSMLGTDELNARFDEEQE